MGNRRIEIPVFLSSDEIKEVINCFVAGCILNDDLEVKFRDRLSCLAKFKRSEKNQVKRVIVSRSGIRVTRDVVHFPKDSVVITVVESDKYYRATLRNMQHAIKMIDMLNERDKDHE